MLYDDVIGREFDESTKFLSRFVSGRRPEIVLPFQVVDL